MQPQIENLVKLQTIDLECAALAKTASALPSEITRAEAALAQAERNVADATAALAKEEALRRSLDSDIVSHRQKVTRVRAQLDNVTTSAQAAAIEHEIQYATSEADRLEEEGLASLERTETHDAALAKAKEEVESLSPTLVTVRASVARRQQEITDQTASLQSQRTALRPLIDSELLMRFDRIAQSRGTGIASAENQQCSGCRMTVRPQAWNLLREGELLNCDSCGRILYWNQTIPTAPPEPRPELLPGQGQALGRTK